MNEELMKRVMKKIKNDSKCKPNCCVVTQIGPTGPQCTSGITDFADFFALMPPDNAATLVPGTDVIFPQGGEISRTSISRTRATTFNLAEIGSYQVLFQVGVTVAGQLELTLNNEPIQSSVVGRATGTSQIIGMSIVTATSINSI